MKNSKMLLILSIFIFMCSLILSACDKPERQTTPIAYQIEFYSDNNLYHTIETAGNNKLNLPIKPTKNGLHFNGWFFDGGEELTSDYYQNKALTKNIFVNAKWTHYILFMALNATETPTIYTNGNEPLTLPTPPISNLGYTFVGWYYYKNGEWQQPFDISVFEHTALTENITVWARWTNNTEEELPTINVTGIDIYYNGSLWNTSNILTLEVGDTAQFSATVLPSNATNKTVTWSSEDTQYLTVTSNGLVTTKKETNIFYWIFVQSGNVEVRIKIKINAAPVSPPAETIPVTDLILYLNGVIFDPKTYYLIVKVDKSVTLNYEIVPENATNVIVSETESTGYVSITLNTTNKTLTYTGLKQSSIPMYTYITVTADNEDGTSRSYISKGVYVKIDTNDSGGGGSNSTTITTSNYSTYISLSLTGTSTKTLNATFKSGYSGNVTLYLTFYATITYKEFFTNEIKTMSVTSINDYFRPLSVGGSSISVGRYDFAGGNGTFISINITGYKVISASGSVFY